MLVVRDFLIKSGRCQEWYLASPCPTLGGCCFFFPLQTICPLLSKGSPQSWLRITATAGNNSDGELTGVWGREKPGDNLI